MNLSLGKQPWYVQVGAFVALSVAAVVAFYFLYASAAQDEAATKITKLQTLRAEIDKGHATERRLPQFKMQLSALEARLEGLRAVLPEEKDIGDLIRRMQALAVQSNIAITNIKPVPVVTKEMYAEVPHEVAIEGTYHNLGLFLDRLSRLSRIINVGDLQIKAKDKPEPMATITARCVATTYVLIEAPKPGAPAAPGATPAAGAAR